MKVPRIRLATRHLMLIVAIAVIPIIVATERARVRRWQCLWYASQYAEAAAWYRSEARGDRATLNAADRLDQIRIEFETAADRPWSSTPPLRTYPAPVAGPTAKNSPAP